ncbi:DUF3822 family protein [Aureitalea sp. L0-47]|uniref:DUF3822 family protein n=1 Tax=Aureitalea sp. L0-47 TaxID=2816962 RepID=UPI002237CFF6|nr:DUF3822 family protein [Aureitalea sp. L0-47]MCW5520795.1 DUF3822 family protein [Aureitalea sp. L0-47]
MTQTTSNSIQNIPNKRLSVQVSLTGLSFLVTNSIRTEVLHFSEKTYTKARTPEELLLDIASFVRNDLGEVATVESVKVIYSNPEYALVPSTLFDESKASDYLKFNSKILVNDYIAWDEVQNRGLHVVYVPYVNVNNFLYDTFGGFEYFHVASVMLNLVPSANRFSESPEVFIYVDRASFQMVIQKNGELQLCNAYPYTTPEDFIYYVLFCFEQLELNPDSVKVTFLGMVSEHDSLYEIAYTYIRNIDFMETTDEGLFIEDSLPHERLLLKSI